MNRKIVSDTGPLISLEKIEDGYGFIQKLFDKIIIPPKVLEELVDGYDSSKDYLKRYKIENLIVVQEPEKLSVDAEVLHEGEAQAISLAIQPNLPLLIEEIKGRQIADQFHLQFSGIARQIVVACEKNLIDQEEAKIKLEEMLEKRRINQEVYQLLTNQNIFHP